MEESNSSDHLNSSLTDLMTSLMVIFILLLLVFVTRSAGKDRALADRLLKDLQGKLVQPGFDRKNIQKDTRDPTAILLIVPDRLMNFELGKADLKPDGAAFLTEKIPVIAGILCSAQFRDNVESITVEGHTDKVKWKDHSDEESQNLNLKLSQNRSLAVVQVALGDLAGRDRGCFLEKLAATGRGDQDYDDNAPPEESRRVIFRIRVKAKDVVTVMKAIP